MQQIAQSIINNHLSLMFLVNVSTSTVSSSRMFMQRHTSTENFVEGVQVEI